MARQLKKWHAMMAANFYRIAAQCNKRGHPESEGYFRAKAEDHKVKSE